SKTGGSVGEGQCHRDEEDHVCLRVTNGKVENFSGVVPKFKFAANKPEDEPGIDIDKSKKSQYQDIVARRRRKLADNETRLTEVEAALLKAKQVLQGLKDKADPNKPGGDANLKNDGAYKKDLQEAQEAATKFLLEKSQLTQLVKKLREFIQKY